MNTPSQEILRYFKYDHLPEPLNLISGACATLAHDMERNLDDGPEKTTALPKAPAEPYIGPQDGAQYLDGLGNDKDGLR